MDREKILDKIKKCLALSQSPEPAEAAAAMRQAQKLMELHSVAQGDLVASDLGEAEVRSRASVSRIKQWELELFNLVGKSFGCRLLWSKSSSYRSGEAVFGKYTFIGLKTQVELASYTVVVLQRKLIKARAKFVQAHGAGGRATTADADTFCRGWVEGVAKTVSEFTMGPELKQAIDERVESTSSGKRAKAQHRAGDLAALLAGQQAAAGESIHRPMQQRADLYLG